LPVIRPELGIRAVAQKQIENWLPASLQQRLVKTEGRLVKQARYYWLMLAEEHLTRGRVQSGTESSRFSTVTAAFGLLISLKSAKIRANQG
jgi:hypothetical protein